MSTTKKRLRIILEDDVYATILAAARKAVPNYSGTESETIKAWLYQEHFGHAELPITRYEKVREANRRRHQELLEKERLLEELLRKNEGENR